MSPAPRSWRCGSHLRLWVCSSYWMATLKGRGYVSPILNLQHMKKQRPDTLGSCHRSTTLSPSLFFSCLATRVLVRLTALPTPSTPGRHSWACSMRPADGAEGPKAHHMCRRTQAHSRRVLTPNAKRPGQGSRIWVQKWIWSHAHLYLHTQIYICIMHMNGHTCMHTCRHTYTHTYEHYTYRHVCRFV